MPTTTATEETTVTHLPEHEAEAARQFAAKLEAETGVSVDGDAIAAVMADENLTAAEKAVLAHEYRTRPPRDDDYTPEAVDRDAEVAESKSPARKRLACRECGRVIVDFERVAHWQTHQSGWSPDPAPRADVDAMFTAVNPD